MTLANHLKWASIGFIFTAVIVGIIWISPWSVKGFAETGKDNTQRPSENYSTQSISETDSPGTSFTQKQSNSPAAEKSNKVIKLEGNF